MVCREISDNCHTCPLAKSCGLLRESGFQTPSVVAEGQGKSLTRGEVNARVQGHKRPARSGRTLKG